MSLLAVDDLHVSFRGEGGQPGVDAVRGATLDIGEGETVALVGESGCGKSVTALSVLGLLPYPKAHHPGGSIRLRRRYASTISPSTMAIASISISSSGSASPVISTMVSAG